MNVKLSHLNSRGHARMVNVGGKAITARTAVAAALVHVNGDFRQALQAGTVPKGDVFAAARIAGIMAAKKTAELIPLCHPLRLDSVTVDFQWARGSIRVTATARCEGKTGVEMEALTAVSVAALTIYDMGKAVDRAMTIGPIYLQKKSGGKSDFLLKKPRR